VPGAVGQPPHDPSRPPGPGQGAPLTPEYQARFEANLVDQARGGQSTSATFTCLPNGMPRMMSAYEPIEFVVTPDITYVLIDHIEHSRHVYTDGRDWPKAIEPTWVGYSIGKWIDEDGDGRYDALEIESRGFKGPRAYDASGLPLHEDNESIFKERIWLDKADRDLLHDEITTIDHALTRPWTVTKNYHRNSYPITGIPDCCGRATTGHAAAPARPAMNCRRFIESPHPPRIVMTSLRLILLRLISWNSRVGLCERQLDEDVPARTGDARGARQHVTAVDVAGRTRLCRPGTCCTRRLHLGKPRKVALEPAEIARDLMAVPV
jgi:hypothetical protein